VGSRVSQRTDDVEELGDGAGKAMSDDERQRAGFGRPHVEEVDRLAVDHGGELRDGVERDLLRPPVVRGPPVVCDLAEVADRHASAPTDIVELLRPSRADESLAQILEGAFRDIDAEWPDLIVSPGWGPFRQGVGRGTSRHRGFSSVAVDWCPPPRYDIMVSMSSSLPKRQHDVNRPVRPVRTAAGDAFTDLVVRIAGLGAYITSAGEALARVGGQTLARWVILDAIEEGPATVAQIARGRGIARQAVQRVADILVADGLARYEPNPAHRRAKLLRPTEQGRAALQVISAAQQPWADALGAEIGQANVQQTLRLVDEVRATVEARGLPGEPSAPRQPRNRRQARRSASGAGPAVRFGEE
jgi:DNA-binding MarR family transcriptional regulator